MGVSKPSVSDKRISRLDAIREQPSTLKVQSQPTGTTTLLKRRIRVGRTTEDWSPRLLDSCVCNPPPYGGYQSDADADAMQGSERNAIYRHERLKRSIGSGEITLSASGGIHPRQQGTW